MTGSSQAKQAMSINCGGHHAETLVSVDHAEYQASHQAQLSRPLLGHKLASQAIALKLREAQEHSKSPL